MVWKSCQGYCDFSCGLLKVKAEVLQMTRMELSGASGFETTVHYDKIGESEVEAGEGAAAIVQRVIECPDRFGRKEKTVDVDL